MDYLFSCITTLDVSANISGQTFESIVDSSLMIWLLCVCFIRQCLIIRLLMCCVGSCPRIPHCFMTTETADHDVHQSVWIPQMCESELASEKNRRAILCSNCSDLFMIAGCIGKTFQLSWGCVRFCTNVNLGWWSITNEACLRLSCDMYSIKDSFNQQVWWDCSDE